MVGMFGMVTQVLHYHFGALTSWLMQASSLRLPPRNAEDVQLWFKRMQSLRKLHMLVVGSLMREGMSSEHSLP